MKDTSNHKLRIEILRKMTPEQRLNKAFDLSQFTRDLFKLGLRKSFPNLTEDELHKLYLKRMEKCHNRNY